jgi:hypothetical protein
MKYLDRAYGDIIDEYGYLSFKKLYEAIGAPPGSIFRGMIPGELFTPEELKAYWPDLVRLGVLAGSNGRLMFFKVS